MTCSEQGKPEGWSYAHELLRGEQDFSSDNFLSSRMVLRSTDKSTTSPGAIQQVTGILVEAPVVNSEVAEI